MKKVLVTATNYSRYCRTGKQMLEAYGCEILENPGTGPYTKEELLELAGNVDGVIAGTDLWDEEVLRAAGRLKGIARFGTGVDNIDLKAAGKLGICVANCPGANSSAVAELAVGLILSAVRGIPASDRNSKAGRWDRPMGRELGGKTVGILGFGAIGRMTARKLSGFDVKLLAYDRFPDREAAGALQVTLCREMEEVLAQSDILTVHMPSLPETRGIFDRKAFESVKRGAVFINTARPDLVDMEALEEALEEGRLSAAASDVLPEPYVKKGGALAVRPDFICTQYLAAETYENYERTSRITAEALIDIFEGKVPKHCLVRP